jgi:lipoprotein NlpD
LNGLRGKDAIAVVTGLVRISATALILAALSACVSRPAGTDMFGRPIGPPAAAETPRVVDDGGRLPDGIVLRPLPAAAPPAIAITTDARAVPASTTIVQPGDTLRGIGNRTGAGSEAIAAANALTPPFALRSGQRLTIPAGRYHEVRVGQTGIAIARAYRIDWGAIVAENGLAAPYVLRVGQRLRLPGSADGTAMTLEQRAAAFTLDIDDIVTGSQPASAAPVSVARPAPSPVSGSTGFVWPLEGRILQRFGPAGGGRVNDGIKIAATLGSPVRAARGGTIVYAGSDVPLLGGLVLIDHGGGWIGAYGHLDRVAVAVGDRVAPGAIFATAGESGQAREPQLHFELRQNRRSVDPLRQLPPR